MVKNAFSWRVLVFSWFGLLLHGAWISGLLAGAASLSFGALLPGPISWLLHLSLHVGFAAFTAEIRAWELRLNSASPGPIVMAANPRAALLRLIDQYPAILSRPARAGLEDNTVLPA
ncbi:hypothetical protein [Tanticharoenia sakaeratensis]|uniref:Uncharacterized protein n=1 Tax=Tanticharoenia sakaeratensis NBRC 103193 TaxID=1231623 RepID=A0A0D6MHT3_9PROT|nr:hypothetical protein [Tanticharoenia sakaeratensis]GAN53192.1 hypothetical protein Tasa_007_037 [Tanticharoenia sakaeratensis NBRC 103193]GBQ23988.1 hypothetical protein AA103193_2596 [Tanticharoenia sakaeratensis NBRC 103193]